MMSFKTVKRIADRFFDLLEIYIPMVMFFTVFLLYIIMIVMRYVSHGQVGKYFELCQIAFIWCSIAAASYGGRTNQHVVFGLVYDKCPEKLQQIFQVVGNLLTVVAFVIILPYACEAVDFLKIKKSDLLRIPFNLIYAPFITFVVLMIIHYINALVKSVKLLLHSGKEKNRS